MRAEGIGYGGNHLLLPYLPHQVEESLTVIWQHCAQGTVPPASTMLVSSLPSLMHARYTLTYGLRPLLAELTAYQILIAVLGPLSPVLSQRLTVVVLRSGNCSASINDDCTTVGAPGVCIQHHYARSTAIFCQVN